MSSKQAAHQTRTTDGGGTRPELQVVRIDNPTNRFERRAAKRASRRGTALQVSAALQVPRSEGMQDRVYAPASPAGGATGRQ